MPKIFSPLVCLLLLVTGAPLAAQVLQSPTSVAIRGERGSFSVTYRSREGTFEPGRGTLCTEVRDAFTGQRIGPGQLAGRPVRCSGRVLDRDPRPMRSDRRRVLGEEGAGIIGGCEPGAPCGMNRNSGMRRFRDRVRLSPGASELILDAVRENGQGVVYWVREFRLNGFEGAQVGIAVAVRPSGNALTGDLAILSADIFAVSEDGDRINGAIRVDVDSQSMRLRARLRTSGSGRIDAYWVVRRPGQSGNRSTWRRVARASFRAGSSGRQIINGPRLGELPLNLPGRYDVSLYFMAGARNLSAVEAPTVTVWRPVE